MKLWIVVVNEPDGQRITYTIRADSLASATRVAEPGRQDRVSVYPLDPEGPEACLWREIK